MFYKCLNNLLFLALSFVLTTNISLAQSPTDKAKEEKVDSTLLFRQIPPNDNETPVSPNSNLDVFALPDIDLPPTPPEIPTESVVNKERSIPMSSSFVNYPLPDIKVPSSQTNTSGTPSAPSIPGLVATAPAPTPTTKPVADKSAAITLPIPMIDIGIAKTALPTLGNNAGKGTLATQNQGIQQLPERMIDASQFDIAGILLGASPAEATQSAEEYGFIKVDENYAIPEFLVWRYKEICKNEGYLIYKATQDCIKKTAEEKGERYISEISLDKPDTKEKIKVYFTSNFGDNMAYKIIYVTEGDYSLGTSAEAVYKKRARRRLFWQRVLEKYGLPSDTMRMIWTDGFDKPSLKAMMHRSTTNGQLVLESPSITDKDAYAMYKLNRSFKPLKDFSF